MDTKIVYKMRPYMSILYTKYTHKIDNFVHIFVILVYKIDTKSDPKTTVPSKILIQNDYTKWIKNENTRLYALVYKIGTKFDQKKLHCHRKY